MRTPIREEADVTEDILRLAEIVYDGAFKDKPSISWSTFMDLLEANALIDLGPDSLSPAMRRIQNHVNTYSYKYQ